VRRIIKALAHLHSMSIYRPEFIVSRIGSLISVGKLEKVGASITRSGNMLVLVRLPRCKMIMELLGGWSGEIWLTRI